MHLFKTLCRLKDTSEARKTVEAVKQHDGERASSLMTLSGFRVREVSVHAARRCVDLLRGQVVQNGFGLLGAAA